MSARAEGGTQRRGLANLKLTVSEARVRFRELIVRNGAVDGKRQGDFIPVDTLRRRPLSVLAKMASLDSFPSLRGVARR
jgi:hypothetical protein